MVVDVESTLYYTTDLTDAASEPPGSEQRGIDARSASVQKGAETPSLQGGKPRRLVQTGRGVLQDPRRNRP